MFTPSLRPLRRASAMLAALLMPFLNAAATEQGISLVAVPSSVPVLPEPLPDKPPVAVHTVAPVFPVSFFRAGRVYVELVVAADGRIVNPYIVRSTNPWLERPALEAVLQWEFAPALKHGLPVAAKVTQVIEFFPKNFTGSGSSPWRARKARHHDQLPDDVRWDEAPEELASSFPAYPHDALLAEKSGRATIRFRINPQGIVATAEVVKATGPDFGGAALASVGAWRFKPARRKGEPCSALVTMDFDFDPVSGGDVPVCTGMKQVARELRRPAPRIEEVGRLDRPPSPLSQKPPAYPAALRSTGKPGTAEIEYCIDPDGDVQIPRIVAASQTEFGYAAAQAVACWRFAPPSKNGRTVIARARASFSFYAPVDPASTGSESVIISTP